MTLVDERNFERPAPPENAKKVFLSAICGTGMGSFAAMLKEAGFKVSGSDENIYPPMSELLERLNIPVVKGFSEDNLKPPPDLLIVGNACTPSHPEAKYARENGLAQLSFSEALARYFIKERHSVVVAGTHGKTTTTALIAHLLTHAGLDPTYLVGGVLVETGVTFRVGQSDFFVCEGDEYDSAYFDKRPKFIHYRPKTAIVTSVEYDHADIYPDFEAYKKAFREFISLIPPEGSLIYFVGCPETVKLAQESGKRLLSYGLSKEADISAADPHWDERGSHFTLVEKGKPLGRLTLPMWGRHNLNNSLSVCAAALSLGLSFEQIIQGLAVFKGVKRRQEVILADKITIIDDFAHHPTAVYETIAAIRQGFPSRRIIAAFDPRSNTSRRKIFERQYANALKKADVALITDPQKIVGLAPEERFSAKTVAASLNEAGVKTYALETPKALAEKIKELWREGDVLLIMSNGNFGGIIPELKEAALAL